METLGQLLKREREFRGISLEKLAEQTRINQKILKGIEEDNIPGAPHEIYVRGFLRTYARHVGLNVQEILSRFEAQKGDQKPAEPAGSPQAPPRPMTAGWRHPLEGVSGALPFAGDDSSRWQQILMALAVVGALVALAALISTR